MKVLMFLYFSGGFLAVDVMSVSDSLKKPETGSASEALPKGAGVTFQQEGCSLWYTPEPSPGSNWKGEREKFWIGQLVIKC